MEGLWNEGDWQLGGSGVEADEGDRRGSVALLCLAGRLAGLR